MNGILNVYKPEGITSFSAVARVKKFTGEKRIGHAGTLDPLATGVLPLLIGKAACMQEMLSNHDKTYIAGVRLGTVTDTGDVTGKILSENKTQISDEAFAEALSAFVGKQKQVPPMYSAIQVDGKRLYDLARQGIEVERQARDIEIYSAKVICRENDSDFKIEVSCSKGTYIRTLCEDIGQKLGVGACMYSLERTVCGQFEKKDCVSLLELEEYFNSSQPEKIEEKLIKPECIFSDLKKVYLPAFYSKLCINGCEIYTKKARVDEKLFENGAMCRIYTNDKRFIGPGELHDFPDGKAIKIKYRFI